MINNRYDALIQDIESVLETSSQIEAILAENPEHKDLPLIQNLPKQFNGILDELELIFPANEELKALTIRLQDTISGLLCESTEQPPAFLASRFSSKYMILLEIWLTEIRKALQVDTKIQIEEGILTQLKKKMVILKQKEVLHGKEEDILVLIDHDKYDPDEFLDHKELFDLHDIQYEKYYHIAIFSEYFGEIKELLMALGIPEAKILPPFACYNDYCCRLKNRDFSIVSDCCWGGYVYQQLGLEYTFNTPFVWKLIRQWDYLKLLKDLRKYMDTPMTFTEEPGVDYPIGVLEDINLYFGHYKTNAQARRNWRSRLNKFQWDNLFFKMSITDEKAAEEFEKLPYEHKIGFADKDYRTASTIWVEEWDKVKFSGKYTGFNNYLHHHYNEFFNVIDWLNGGTGKIIT